MSKSKSVEPGAKQHETRRQKNVSNDPLPGGG